jgi:hypothetical protein
LIPRLCPASTVDIDLLAVQADAAAGGDEDIAIMQRIGEVRQAGIAGR